jgi:hypothetical protein
VHARPHDGAAGQHHERGQQLEGQAAGALRWRTVHAPKQGWILPAVVHTGQARLRLIYRVIPLHCITCMPLRASVFASTNQPLGKPSSLLASHAPLPPLTCLLRVRGCAGDQCQGLQRLGL